MTIILNNEMTLLVDHNENKNSEVKSNFFEKN